MVLVGAEILTGIFFGALTRILISAAHTAGTILAQQSGLAAAQILDITQTGQSTVMTNLISVTAATLLFATDLHHVMLRAVVDSYALFPVGLFPPVADFSQYAMRLVGNTFAVAIQLSAPFIVVGLILYLTAGVMARLMPAMQIFFILLPPQMMLSFFVLMVCIGPIMLWYMHYIEDTMGNFLQLP
jgi:flagellar biosynthetic protein FliR